MGSQTRNQEYTYQYKNISVANTIFCGYGPNIQINLPENVLAIKNLFVRLTIRFDPAETTPGVASIIMNGLPQFSYFYAGTIYTVPVNWQANTSTHILDARIDLSGLVNHMYIFPGTVSNQPYIILSLSANNNTYFTSINNRILLWKIDLTYTTQGIR